MGNPDRRLLGPVNLLAGVRKGATNPRQHQQKGYLTSPGDVSGGNRPPTPLAPLEVRQHTGQAAHDGTRTHDSHALHHGKCGGSK